MTGTSHISIAAFVSEGERAAVQLAAGYIARALSQADAVPWTCDCIFTPDMEALQQGGDAAILITSLVPELAEIEEPWPRAERRLRMAYMALGEGKAPVFICSILRHVGNDEGPEAAAALRLNIRRLNLLVADISRETKAYVIDVDRVLADIGARRLQTDYRLGGNFAADMTGHFIALTLIANVFDAFVSVEVQDAAKSILSAARPPIPGPNNAEPEVTFRRHLQPTGQGRQKQIVWSADPQNYAGSLIRQALRGTIRPAEALHRLRKAFRRLGVRETVMLLASGFSRRGNRKK